MRQRAEEASSQEHMACTSETIMTATHPLPHQEIQGLTFLLNPHPWARPLGRSALSTALLPGHQ